MQSFTVVVIQFTYCILCSNQ